MKRSASGDFTKNKKQCISTSPNNNNKPITNKLNITPTTTITTLNSTLNKVPANNKMTANVLEQIKDMVLHLDKDDLEYCITRSLPEMSTIPNNVDDEQHKHKHEEEEQEDISILLHKALKNIATRQLKLETENKRYRIAIKQQHHLLTHDDCNNNKSSKEEEEENESIVNNIIDNGTPEDCISSFRQSPMLNILQLSGKKKIFICSE